MELYIGGVNFSQRFDSLALSGSITVCARTLQVGLVCSPFVAAWATPSILPHSAVVCYDDDGVLVFQGVVVQTSRDSLSAILTVTAMDHGYFLASNEGYYTFDGMTVEGAVASLCGDIGLGVADLATTGVTVSRHFSGIALHKIVDTLYTLASEKTGQQYHIRFSGTSLSVVAKPEDSALVLDPQSNLYSSVNTIDVTDYCNTVDIYDETGNFVQQVGGSEELAGMLRQIVTQKDGEDASGEAALLIEDGCAVQSVTVECAGDLRLVTGNAVVVTDSESGAQGLFWIDSDSHLWNNGNHTVTLTLNFRNIMNETSSGTEVS